MSYDFHNAEEELHYSSPLEKSNNCVSPQLLIACLQYLLLVHIIIVGCFSIVALKSMSSTSTLFRSHRKRLDG